MGSEVQRFRVRDSGFRIRGFTKEIQDPGPVNASLI